MTDCLEPIHQLWRVKRDDVGSHISRSRQACIDNKGKTTLKTRLADLDKSVDNYSLTWTQYLSELTQERIDLELFLKSHTKLQQEIDDVKDLLGDALDSVGSQTLKTDAHLKLPEIKIPEFSGNSSDWEQFWDLFTSLIDSRTDLPVSVKFSFLKSALKGTSAKLIAGFSVTQANYEEAKSLLVKQYKDDGRIARKLSGQLLDLKSPGHCHRDLSDFKIGYEQILRSLRPYHKVSDASWLVLEILIRKVSVETRTFLFQHHGQQYFSLEEFDEGLDVLISLLEGTNLKQRATESTTKPVKDTSLVKSNVAITKSTDTCMFCSEEHRSSRCPTYVSPEARRTVLFKENRCLKCCRKGHKANMCKTKVHCYNCKGSHHTLLCKGSKPKSDSSDSTSKPKDTTTQNPPSIKNSANEQPVNQLETHSVITSRVSTLASNGGGGTALPTAILRLKTRVPSNVVNTVRCFFDSGSQKSFIHPKVLKELDLKPTGSTTFHLATFGRESEPVQCATIKLRLSLGTKVFSIPFVVSDKVEMKLHIPGLSHTIKMLKKSGLRLADHKAQDQLNDISVVIGADHFSKFIRGTTRIQGVNLFSSTGGYIIYGQLPCDKSDSTVDVNTVVMSKIQVQDQMVDSCLLQDLPKPPIHNLWELDTIGIKEDSLTVGERHAVDFFTKSIQYDGDKYWVRLPWKRDPSEVPTNYRMAVGQLNSLQTHLSKNSSKFDQYNQVIREYLHNDFVEEVVDSQVKGHYLPHHGVAKESKTTPLRVVFNASAKSKSSDLSLNDALETGPSLTEKLASSLINLRIGKFAVIADISKAFLRIGLQAQDRDYVRFLWSDDPTSFPKTYRFKSVLFGSTSSPFLLQATLQRHFETCQTPMEQKLSKSFYVDNFQHSVDSEVELSEVHQLLTSCMSKAGMPLQDWNSNSPVFNSTFSEDNRKICPTVLGITWNTQSDTLSIKPVVVPQFKQLTKRKALSICSQVYDPLGLLSPVTVKSKVFLQELWKDSKGWDDPLDPETIDTFNGLVSEYRLLDQLQFPRMVSTKSDGCRLHVFCDASAKAYGAVAYLCHDNETSLLTSKRRVPPDKRKAFPYPGPPPLPMERVQYVHPFECTGVDFTGAIKVRNRSGETQKLYICLFTCVATRAVHLQLINSLSAEAFVLCLRRFVAKCSLPSKLLSDNGTNFVAVSKFLVELQDEAVVQDYLTTHKIKWQFISPRAPWQGGVYERMIGLTKNCLSKALHHRQVTPEELVTILAEVEAILNNRPLTYINDDDREGEILTPAHLLYGRGIILYPFFQMEERNTAPCNLNTLVLYHNHISCIIEKFHSLFVDNYLTMLREKHYLSRKPPSRCPKLGEVVILSIDMPKVLWHLGRVVKLIPSADSIVREVEVITKNTIVRRTVDKLIPLELCSSEDDNIPLANNPNLEISPPADQIEAEPQLSVRPKRKTAEAAENFVRDLIRKDLL